MENSKKKNLGIMILIFTEKRNKFHFVSVYEKGYTIFAWKKQILTWKKQNS